MKKRKPSVLVACEFSGIVRTEFEKRGWNAVSCDLLPTELPGKHFQCDVLGCLHSHNKWDLLIAHPPCTFLANSSAKHLYLGMKKENGEDPWRWKEMRKGARFFKALWEADVPFIAIENPVMLRYAQEIIGCGPTQSIQPYEFGHGETKRTCLWLKNLPPLKPTKLVDGRQPRVHFCSPGPDRWKERSRTLTGIAEAMADQWGKYVKSKL